MRPRFLPALLLLSLLIACGGDDPEEPGGEMQDSPSTPPWTSTRLTCNTFVSVKDWVEMQKAWKADNLGPVVRLKDEQGRYGQVSKGAEVRVMETRRFTVQGDTFTVRRIQTPSENLVGSIGDRESSVEYGVWVSDADSTTTTRENCLEPYSERTE